MTEFQSLTTLIKRLEAATSRLEDLATSGASAVAAGTSLSRKTLGNQPTAPLLVSPPTAEKELPPALAAYDSLIEGPLKNFVELSKSIGGLIEDQSHAVEEIFIAQRDFIYIASQSIQPKVTSETFVELIKPTQRALEKVCEYRENNRPSPFFNHLCTVSEGITALGWVSVEPKPAPYVNDYKESSRFYSNRVIKEFKDKDQNHVDWANSFVLLLTELESYVKKYHTTGLVWNPKGVDAKTFVGRKPIQQSGDSSVPALPPAPPVGGPPVPPPPPPPVDFGTTVSASSGQPDMNAVFSELNRGEEVTANLRKVDKSQMTHKNPELRAGNTVGDVGVKSQKKGPTAPPKPASLSLKKPPKTQLNGTKWVVENHENNNNVIIEETAINHSVYIFGCKNSTIQIKGKINAVTLDSCQKTGLLLDSVVSSADVVNCKSFQLQILGRTPTIAVDKSDSGQIFLSRECLDVEILTAKSSSVNVNLPGVENDYEERPIPEQFKSTIVDGKLVSCVVEHTG